MGRFLFCRCIYQEHIFGIGARDSNCVRIVYMPWEDDDPVVAALSGKAPAIPAPFSCGGSLPKARGVHDSSGTPSAQRQQSSTEEERYDTATILLERAMDAHATAAAAAAAAASSSRRSHSVKRKEAAAATGMEDPSNYYCAVTCCEARAGACACHLGAFGCGRYRDCLCCRCLKAPRCGCGGLLAAPTPHTLLRR